MKSHLTLSEGPKDGLEHTPEQLEEMDKIRGAIRRCNKARFDREHEEDLEGFKARAVAKYNAWAAKNPEKVVLYHHNSKQRAIYPERFFCAECNLALGDANALTRHEQSAVHERQVAINTGAAVPPTQPGTRATRKSIKKANNLKKYFCKICLLLVVVPQPL